MIVGDLDHINLRTPDPDSIVRFYCDILGLHEGPRPAFSFPGAWLYAGVKPLVHITVGRKRNTDTSPRVDHFAFSAQDLRGALAKLRKNNIPYTTQLVPGSEVRQVFFRDPDGNRVELDFHAHEKGDMSDFPGHASAGAK